MRPVLVGQAKDSNIVTVRKKKIRNLNPNSERELQDQEPGQ